jgi:predicted lipoprotein with Yx(FWY)xxD motif
MARALPAYDGKEVMTAVRRTFLPVALAGTAVLLFATGCMDTGSSAASYGSGQPQPSQQQQHPPGHSAAGAAGQAEADEPGLSAIRAFDIGQLVVDGGGFTLYRSDKDTAKPPKSNCAGKCAEDWPPMESVADLKLHNIDQALVGSVIRADGVEQVTLAGWPLYRHAADEMPGETSGQSVNGTWFAASPDGGKVTVPEGGVSGEFGL